jgi:16S rRNA (guanine527-N7)-methyltransferase
VREGQTELVRGAQAMGITLNIVQQRLLLDYVDVLFKWNNAYNLTAVREKTQMISRHILDSLSIVNFIKGKKILDVGSGAGLPGIVLAIYFPDKHITLVDSNGKKTRFLQTVKQTLMLDNITVIQTRVENMNAGGHFDCITSRAFAELGKMIKLTAHLLEPKGQFVAMKGQVLPEELSAIDKHYKVHVHPMTVPDCDAARHALVITEGD